MQLCKNRGRQRGAIGGVGPERPVALDQADEALRGKGRGERGGDSDGHRAAQLGRGAAALESPALQCGGADDDRQRRPFGRAGSPARGRSGGRGPRPAWRRCARPPAPAPPLGQLPAPARRASRPPPPTLLRSAVGECHRRRAAQQSDRGRPWPAEAPLDRSLKRVTDDRRRGEGERQHRRPAQVEVA